ncbi:dTDP-4-amino-4,6-dideoxygalactose transaminase [Murinocardiopsis flavida]|uniref:dTDP-4-amino-4,6-dideoxygalactose transaminase n=1 Tax=Murinocardiopsis flavida TaxID=645275 RepID=A0A2P8DTJ2_9ACTN|nr:DegT/DnrJ/EryC1/StrS family aminotransferase [Murinocardiopsis flavida]PSL00537.1 dTDP-4-amino-4,6-dideoxygalactose transaminase [Murinocardiopsis flavida]
MIPLFKVNMSEQAPAAVAEVLASGQIGQGPKVVEFEERLAERLGSHRVATVNSATSGLHLALHMVDTADGRGPDPDAEVLTTPLTMEATNWTILANRLRIRWVDTDPGTLNMDLDDLARKIGPKTRAIVVVHLFGYPIDYERLDKVLDDAEASHGFRPVVIEDCAHAWGATYRGTPVGTRGNIAVFSFQAVKHLVCGDGGALVLPDDALLQRARLLRWFGIEREARLAKPPDVAEWGFKFHLTDINAAMGLANLDEADAAVAACRANAAFYDRELSGLERVELTDRSPDHVSSYWAYPLLVADRPAFIRHMTDAGVMTSVVHRRNDLHSCVSEFTAPLPGLDAVAERLVCLPVGPWVTEAQREQIVTAVRAPW